MHRSWGFVVAALLAVLAGSGCGTDKVREGLSRTAYLTRADAICTATNARLLTLGPPRTAEEFGPFAQKAVPVLERGLSRLRGLRPPAEMSGDVNAFHARIDRLIAAFRQAGAAAQARNPAAVRRSAAEASAQAEAAAAQAKAIGFRVCGRIPRI
jgi:hypothetical protein